MRRRLLEECGCTSEFINCVAGDICLVNNDTLDKLIVSYNEYDLTNYPSEEYTPIGVVVVPESHTEDGTVRIISLADMDYNNPDNGNTDGNVYMHWGGYGYDVLDLDYLTQAPYIADSVALISSPQTLVGFNTIALNNFCYFCSDYFVGTSGAYPNPFDSKAAYGSNSDNVAVPSPYLEDGSKNPIYHDTSNTGNVCADMDGKGNTEKILAVDNSYSTSWQTASTIQNVHDNQYIHPAAQCCWRYHTIGTNQGEWYLPSAGELGYLAARWKSISASITKIIGFGVVPALVLSLYSWWSSTIYSINNLISVYFTNSYDRLFYRSKTNESYMRAFISI